MAQAQEFDVRKTCTAIASEAPYELRFFRSRGANFDPVAQALASGSADDVAAAVDTYCQLNSCNRHAPWIILTSSRTEVRLGALNLQEKRANVFLKDLNTDTSHAPIETDFYHVLVTAASTPVPSYSAAAVSAVKKRLAEFAANNPFHTLFDLAKKRAGAICLMYADAGCKSALLDALDIGSVGLNAEAMASLTMMGDAEILFTDSAYAQGLALTALKILAHIDQAKNGRPPTAHLFDELVESFREAGFEPMQSQNMAMRYIAFYGARGSSVDLMRELGNAENYPTVVAAYVISAGLSGLDSYTLSSGHPYSLPAEITSTCDFGHPYHFWMGAALAYELVQRKHPLRSAFLAAHILGFGYEMGSSSWGRNPAQIFTHETYSLVAEEMRANIAADDAGARFGAELADHQKTFKSNVDSRFAKIHFAASDLKPLSAQDSGELFEHHKLQFARRWFLLFHPNKALRSVEPRD